MDIEKEKFICTAPWEGLYVDPDGEFRVCCAGKSLGNLNDNSLTDLIEKGPLKDLQNDILTKGYSNYCESCIGSHKLSGSSLRNSYGTDLSNVNTDKFTPNILDIRWRNTCQLRCVYCKPDWSSTYAEHHSIKIEKSKKDWQLEVLDYMKNHSNPRRIMMLGGEPFLMKENEKLLNLVSENTPLVIVTNLALENIHLFPLYQKLTERSFTIMVSLENVGRKFNYVRRNADFRVLEENYKRLQQNCNSIGFQMTYNLLSATSLLETFDWVYSLHPKIEDNKSILSNLLGPTQFNIQLFPKEVKEIAVNEIEKVEKKYKDWLNQSQKTFLANSKETLLSNLDSYKLYAIKNFFKHIEVTDNEEEKQLFKEEWSELYSILIKYR